MANRYAANLAALLPAFESATRTAQGIQDQQRQTQADALNQQLMDLRIKQQKAQLDALKIAQEQEKIRLSFKDQFLSAVPGAGQQAAPSAPLDPEMQGPPAPPAQPDVAGQYRQLATLASQGGEMDLLNNLVAQGAVASPAGIQQQRSKEATVRSQEATADIQEQSLAESKAFMQTRAALAKTLKDRASSAKGIDKSRFELMAQAMQTANEGQVPGILTELYPRVDEPTNAFQALYRQTGNAQKALKIMGDMETQNAIAIQNAKPPTPRRFGEAREAIAAEMFGGKPFGDLTTEEMAKVNKRVEEARTRIAKAGLPTERLPAGAATKMQDIRKLKLTADSVMKQFKPEFVGKFKYVGNKFRILKGTASPELIAFTSDYNNLLDMLARERTGAVIGKEEAAQFKQIIGSEFSEASVFTGRLSSFINNMDMQENIILDVNAQSIEDLQQKKRQDRISELSKIPVSKMTSEQLLEYESLLGQ